MACLCLLALVCAIGDFSQPAQEISEGRGGLDLLDADDFTPAPDLLPEAVADVIQDHFAANRSVQDWPALWRRVNAPLAAFLARLAPSKSSLQAARRISEGNCEVRSVFNINYIESEYNALVSAATYQKLATNIEKAVDA